MTVPSETNRVEYEGNGSTTAFPVPFPFSATSQVVVTLTPAGGFAATLVLGTDYRLEGLNEPAGTLLLTTPPADDAVVAIERRVPVTQETVFTSQPTYAPTTHERAFDYRVYVDQQLDLSLDRLEARLAAIPAPGPVPAGAISAGPDVELVPGQTSPDVVVLNPAQTQHAPLAHILLDSLGEIWAEGT